MSASTFSRRQVLAGAGSLAVAAGLGASLSSCRTSKSGNTTGANQAVKLPTYQRFAGIKPDLPGTDEGVDDAFRTFPKNNPKSVTEVPGDGSKVSTMSLIYYALPPGKDKNPFWQDLNTRLGVDLDLQMVPAADYTQKFATTMAGSDLPDAVLLTSIPNTPQLLANRFANLTEYLSGDAVLEYPNLANLPTASWKWGVYNGGIYTVPIPRGRTWVYNFVRQDLFEAAKVNVDPQSFDELFDTCKALTDPKKKRWAFGPAGQLQSMLKLINDEPNNWALEGDKLVKRYETEQFKQSVSDMIQFWKAGVIHPDGFNPALPFQQYFSAGTVAINVTGYPGWTQYILDNANNPDFELGLMTSPKREGGGLAAWHYGPGILSTVAIKKAEPDRIKLMLRIMNWLAAPFGTEEYLFRLYGKEGRDHTKDANGSPTLTKAGAVNTTLPIRYIADAPYTVFQPGRPQDADTQHAYQSKIMPGGKTDPTTGLFSDAQSTKDATIDKAFTAGINEIIQGRQPISNLDSLLSAWRSGGGDEIRQQMQDQLQKSGAPSK